MQRQRHRGRQAAPDMFRLRRAWKRTPHAWFANDDIARATRIIARAGISEKNRQVKLENRGDAHERRVAARAKRARRNRLRRMNANFAFVGKLDARLAMASHF